MRTFGAVIVAVGLAAVSLAGQTSKLPPGATYGVDRSYNVPRTADGHPDLQGVWSNNSVTPMTRPTQWKTKERLTDAELRELQSLIAQNADDGGDAIFQNQVQLALDAKEKGKFEQISYDKTTGNYNQFWMAGRDWDTRTSLIIDPPNGQFPALTPEAAAKRAGRRAPGLAPAGDGENGPQRPLPAGPEDLPLGERCVSFGAPRTGAGYNSYLQIVQSRTAVVVLQEMAHDARIVPLDARPELPGTVRQWLGDSRGRWEGDTLVVDVGDFNDKTWFDRAGNFHSEKLKLVERFSPLSPDAIRYQVTITDPEVFTRSWTITMPLYRRLEPNAQLIEYRCVEFVEEFLYGHLRKQQLVKHWEGDTIVVDIKRKVPPGELVYERYAK
jgi:hypothetical protein